MTVQESMEFGRKALAAWNAMSDEEKVAFILDTPYGVILSLSRYTRQEAPDAR